MNTAKKVSKTLLIKEFFGMSAAEAVKEYRQLNDKDKVELASAIAIQRGLTQNDVDFELVTY